MCRIHFVIGRSFSIPSKEVALETWGNYSCHLILEYTAVQGLQFNTISRVFKWQAPEYSERCGIEFQLDFTNGHVSLTPRVYEEYYEFPIYPCTINNISVTTFIGFTSEDGETVSYSHLEPVPGKPTSYSTKL